MINQRQYQELKACGLTTVAFPQDLKSEIEKEIASVISKLSKQHSFNGLKESQPYILGLTDKMFRDTFKKPNRTFKEHIGDQILDWVKSTFSGFFEYKNIHISSIPAWEAEQVDGLKPEQVSVYWRCVRPNQAKDVAGAHQDSTFWKIAHNLNYEPICPFKYQQRWKIWLPLFGSEEENALKLLPGSHEMEVPDYIIQSEIGERPVIDESWLNDHEKDFVSPVSNSDGECVLFHDDLVHQGPVNNGKDVRFSVEWTILIG